MGLVYEDGTRVLRGCFFEVQNEVGLGRGERAYQRACEIWLEGRGVPFRSRAGHHLRLGGEIAHTLFPDLVVWDEITVELKAVARTVGAGELAQLFDYLKRRGDRLGLLVNMGLDRVAIERVVYEAAEPTIKECWDYWAGRIEGRDREIGQEIRQATRAVFDEHGTGYSHEVTANLFAFELTRRGLSHSASPVCTASYRSVVVDESPLDCIQVENRIVVVFTALFSTNTFNINRGQSYLKSLNLPWGVAINFGRTHLEITGLRHALQP